MTFSENKYNTVSKYNCRVKTYPDGTQAVLVCSRAIFNPERLEDADSEAVSLTALCDDKPKEQSAVQERSLRRAKQMLKDYILCNDFTHFVTFTIDGSCCDRSDYGAIIKPLNKWLDNRVQRKGLKYLFVPEYHSDGKSIHFHGLVNGEAVTLADSGTVSVQGLKKPVKVATYKRKYADRECHTVYNVTDWKYGFSTAIALYGDRNAVAAYVGKYLEKDLQKIGGRLYLHSNNLALPDVAYMHADFSEFEGEPFNFNDVNIWWKYAKIAQNMVENEKNCTVS